jgi:hypothetical protein
MVTDMLVQFEAAVLRKELEDMAEEKERQYNRAETLEKRLEAARAAAERYSMSASAAQKRVQELEKCVAECLALLMER